MSYREPRLRIKKIDEEVRRRSNLYIGKRNRNVDIPSPKNRFIGRQDITDIPYDVPWQKTVLDQTGVAFAVNENYKCIRCGKEYNSSFPPPVCFRCGEKSFLNNKKVVNFKS